MNISRLFILRPVATTLSMLAIILAGLIAGCGQHGRRGLVQLIPEYQTKFPA